MVDNLQSVPHLPLAVDAAQSQEVGVWRVAIALALARRDASAAAYSRSR